MRSHVELVEEIARKTLSSWPAPIVGASSVTSRSFPPTTSPDETGSTLAVIPFATISRARRASSTASIDTDRSTVSSAQSTSEPRMVIWATSLSLPPRWSNADRAAKSSAPTPTRSGPLTVTRKVDVVMPRA